MTNIRLSADPRAIRTRLHVLQIARQMLNESSGPLTISRVAQRANVSRRTLYVHWGSVENLIAHTLTVGGRPQSDYDSQDLEGRLRIFFTGFAQEMVNGVAPAVASILAAARYDLTSRAALAAMQTNLQALFSARVAALTPTGFRQLIYPMVMTALVDGTVDSELIDGLVERARYLLTDRSDAENLAADYPTMPASPRPVTFFVDPIGVHWEGVGLSDPA